MTRAFLSSGDLIADRRVQYAEMMFESGDWEPALDLMRQALDIVPNWAPGWFRLAEMEAGSGNLAAAEDAWRRTLALDPQDHLGASLRMAATGLIERPETPPVAYVETLFDAYAPTFEKALVGKLDYRAPQLLDAAIGISSGGENLRSVVDMGCGTGLMGELLRSRTEYLEGSDLSEAMLQKAREKNIYDRLEQGDINTPAGSVTMAGLVVAADVFVYVGDLERAFANVSRRLRENGIFAFSVEVHDEDQDLILRESLRYAHSETYVCRLLADHGFLVETLQRETLRMDHGAPVRGLIVVARLRSGG
ncbi:MAG: methyltransferase domain-containing protein [Phyllobacterium sp.]